ncbi:hypothetical protein HYY75_01745, partial [bacterium]|nr:hypothetical protein [bacterium]
VEMKDYVRSILDSVDSGLATLDVRGRLVTANAAFPRILDLPKSPSTSSIREVLIPIPDDSFIESFEGMVLKSSADFQADPNILAKNRKVRTLHRYELPLHSLGNEHRILQLRVHPLISGDSLLGTVLVIDDLTSLKQIERRMFETEKWVSLGRLAASVAHEIRNPLVAIRSLVEMIGEEVTGELVNHVKVVLGEVHRLNSVVEQLLQVSKPEKTEFREASIEEILDELLLLIRHEAVRQKVTIKKVGPGLKIIAKIDPEKIKQAFLNIILNGIQAMPNGGTITILLRESQFPLEGNGGIVQNSRNGTKKWVVVEFIDEGDGIAPENLSRIFDPFFTTKPRGTGLGLAISKKIVDIHNGLITIDSQKGIGTCVRISLPCDLH